MEFLYHILASEKGSYFSKSIESLTTLFEGDFSYVGIFDNMKFCQETRLLDFPRPDNESVIKLDAASISMASHYKKAQMYLPGLFFYESKVI